MGVIDISNKTMEFLKEQPWQDIIEIMDKITIIVAFVTLFFVIRNWNTNKKQLKAIEIYFKIKCLNKNILIENKLTRKDARRSEIQGLLGNKLIKGVTRYNIDYLANKNYFDDVFALQNAKIDSIVIEIESDEIGQYADLIINNLEESEIEQVKDEVLKFVNHPNESPLKTLQDSTKQKLKL